VCASLARQGAPMGSPADYTIIVLLVVIGVGLWTALDRIGALQRDVEAIKRKLGDEDTPRE
ncbi:MAG TPA: hypothetical protein PLS69_14795, partial [Terricaulis sp.]|nr:hypothetical protein [Terricaulis sp.]